MFYLQLSGSNQVIGSCLSNLSKLLQIRSLTQKLKFILILGYAMSFYFFFAMIIALTRKKKYKLFLCPVVATWSEIPDKLSS